MSVRAFLRHARNQHARRATVTVAAVAVVVVATAGTAQAAVVPISVDTFTDTVGQHASQVEPDSFAFGSTIVTAIQTGRWFNGGSSGIAVSRSGDGGATWTTKNLPNLTNNPSTDNPNPGPYDRVSDPVVTYDARHDVWMVSTLPLVGRSTTVGPTAAGVYTSRSTDGGITWGAPVFVTGSNLQSPDKNWIVCDNTATSPFYGNCYTEWDANGDGNRIYMSTSTDGGLTWGPRRRPSNNATGIGGQPVVQPNGTVIVPIDNANETTLRSFRSTNGGASWSNATTITTISHHTVAGGLRTGPLPSAEIDATGRVFVAWQDCRFRAGCTANDIVFVTSTNGTTWSAVQRVPIDAVTSGRDHFIPGLAVDRTTSGATTRLALAYYFYPAASCTAATCQLSVGYVSSANAGATWSAPTTLAGPMSLSWLPATTQGPMVGDYISTSFVGAKPVPVFVRAQAPTGSVLDQRMVAETGLTTARAGAARSQSSPRSVAPASGTARGAFVRR